MMAPANGREKRRGDARSEATKACGEVGGEVEDLGPADEKLAGAPWRLETGAGENDRGWRTALKNDWQAQMDSAHIARFGWPVKAVCDLRTK